VRKILLGLSALPVILLSLACDNNDNPYSPPTDNPAVVTFFNESSFRVRIYKNLNPDSFDQTTLVCSLNAGQTVKTTHYASFDQVVGDVFYIRYGVLLADMQDTQTGKNIYVDAERTLSNITHVVKSGETYFHTISQPPQGELRFVNGYIAVQNLSANQTRVERGSAILPNLDDNGDGLSLATGRIGYYEISIPFLDDYINMNMLKAFYTSYTDFPAFVMDRGKLYRFTVRETGITGPTITNINVAN
jgi:hypothetical protein